MTDNRWLLTWMLKTWIDFTKKPLKPATYQLMPGNTLFLAGLGRIDYLKASQFLLFM